MRSCVQSIQKFRKNEDGSIMMFGIFFALLMLVFTGMAVDLMQTEARRVEVQGTLDNAILAAADVDQKGDPVEVVKDYMAKAGFPNSLQTDPVVSNANGRSVSATATENLSPVLRSVATNYKIVTSGSASNSAPRMEVSMVLDISGSMSQYTGYYGPTRIKLMKDAAKNFVDLLMANGSNKTSISLVPFSEQVNIGPDIMGMLKVDTAKPARRHNYSHCIDMTEADFSKVALDQAAEYTQTQHMAVYYNQNLDTEGRKTDMTHPICTVKPGQSMVPVSSNAATLKAQIDKLEPATNTNISYGMKWGAAMLDPSAQNIVNALIEKEKIDENMRGRPYAYDREDTRKMIVLLTDGMNTSSIRINNELYDGGYVVKTYDFDFSTWTYRSYTLSPEYWAKHNFGYWRSEGDGRHYVSGLKHYTHASYLDSNRRMKSVCDAAKAKGIVIYGVGVSLEEEGRAPMLDCSTSPAHYYDVNDNQIDEAFRSIAMHSIKLRLVE